LGVAGFEVEDEDEADLGCSAGLAVLALGVSFFGVAAAPGPLR
jgi:hypothetical protein